MCYAIHNYRSGPVHYKVQKSIVLINLLLVSSPPITISSSVSGRVKHVQSLRGVGSFATVSHCSVWGQYMAMVEEGTSTAPTVRSVSRNTTSVGCIVGVSGSGCHSVGLGPSLVSVVVSLAGCWDTASDIRAGMDILTASLFHTT